MIKLFRIQKRDTGGLLKFNSVKEIDELVNPSFDAKELKAFYNNDDSDFTISTYTPYKMKRVDTLTSDEVVSLLEHFEADSYEILAEYGTQYDNYTITNHTKSFKHNNEKYTYLFILPDYDLNKQAIYLSNEAKHYEALSKVMTD